jgi:hypothetical protein
MKTPAQRRRNNIEFKKRARRVLKASINLVQQRWGKSGRRKYSIRSKHTYVDAIRYTRSYTRPHPVVIRVYDATGNVIETLEYKGEFKEW